MFSGKADCAVLDKSSIVAAGEPSWVENVFVYQKGVQPDRYYVRFTSGKLEGAWFNIVSNSPYSLVLEISKNELSAVAEGDSFEIIPHWTLNTLFPDGGSLTKSSDYASGTNCSIIAKYTYLDGNGELMLPEGSNRTFQKFFYYRQRNGISEWRERGSGETSFNDEIVEPNSFILLRQPEGVADMELSFAGRVSNAPTALEIGNLSPDSGQDNYIALPSAGDVKLSELTETLIDSGAMNSSSYAVIPKDVLCVYDNSESKTNRAASYHYFYYSGNSSPRGWYFVGSGDPALRRADGHILKSGSAMVIIRQSRGRVEFLRVKFTPEYLRK